MEMFVAYACGLAVGVVFTYLYFVFAKHFGTLVIDESDPQKDLVTMHVDRDFDMLRDKGVVTFKVVRKSVPIIEEQEREVLK